MTGVQTCALPICSLRILLNGREVSRQTIMPEWRPYRVPLPLAAMGRLAGDEVSLELMTVLPASLSGRSSKPEWEVEGINFVSAR